MAGGRLYHCQFCGHRRKCWWLWFLWIPMCQTCIDAIDWRGTRDWMRVS